jgi:hypothetical protein
LLLAWVSRTFSCKWLVTGFNITSLFYNNTRLDRLWHETCTKFTRLLIIKIMSVSL